MQVSCERCLDDRNNAGYFYHLSVAGKPSQCLVMTQPRYTAICSAYTNEAHGQEIRLTLDARILKAHKAIASPLRSEFMDGVWYAPVVFQSAVLFSVRARTAAFKDEDNISASICSWWDCGISHS